MENARLVTAILPTNVDDSERHIFYVLEDGGLCCLVTLLLNHSDQEATDMALATL